MDEVQVEIVDSEFFQSGIAGLQGITAAVPSAHQLGGDEQILSADSGLQNAGSHLSVILVPLRRVYVSVPQSKSLRYCLYALVTVELPRAKA